MTVVVTVVAVILIGVAYQLGRTEAPKCPEPQALAEGSAEMLNLVNEYRLDNNLQPLQTEIHLEAASQWFAQDMYIRGYFNHVDSLGRDHKQRLADFGYPTNTWLVENLGIAFDAFEAFDTWKLSPPHNVNLLNERVNEVGIGVAGNIWVFDAGEAVAPPPPINPAQTPSMPEPTPTPTPEVTPCH